MDTWKQEPNHGPDGVMKELPRVMISRGQEVKLFLKPKEV